MYRPTEDEIIEALAHAVSITTYTCSRSWEAWSYGTMTEDDFTDASEDEAWLYSTMEVVQDATSPLIETVDDLHQLAIGSVVVVNGVAYMKTSMVLWLRADDMGTKLTGTDSILSGAHNARVIHFGG